MADDSSAKNCRLPSYVIPRHYDLHYSSIDLTRHTFSGIVSISIDVQHSSTSSLDSITLHSIELSLLSASISESSSDQSTKPTDAFEFIYNKPSQTCQIRFPQPITPFKSYILSITFQGILNPDMHGLYRSTYTSPTTNEPQTMATTQFEPTNARRAFPCFDEPALKSTFRLTVAIPHHLTCLSNTPPSSQHRSHTDPTTKIITFETTPKMSTYLVALVLGEFDCISKSSSSHQIRTTVYATPGKASQGEFCLDVASKCLDLYSDMFGVKYPLEKSDLVAIPDFAAGAMENWGLVTYREAKILVKPTSTSQSTLRGIARTVCHELAHQWFGNLVTPNFWTQLWLKEGVARYLEFVGIDTLFPNWNAWTEFIQSVFSLALSLDAMKSSHPVEVEVKHPDEMREIYDSISYAKGASIVRMIAEYIGFDIFLKGMNLYLERYQYGDATTEMLWGALEEVSGKKVVKMMEPWTKETGFPLVCLLEGEEGGIETQRFLASGDQTSNEVHRVRWPVPVTAKVQGEDDIQGPWVINGVDKDETRDLMVQIREWNAAEKWFKLNVSQTGFYRVKYTKEQWKRLSEVMSPDGPLSEADRLGLVSDSFAVGKAGYTSIVDSLRLVQKFGGHEVCEYTVWQELSENLSNLSSLYRSAPFFPKLQTFLMQLYSPQFRKLTWDSKPNEPQRTGTLRATVINMLGIAGDETMLSEALRRFQTFAAKEQTEISGDLRRVLFRNALRKDESFVYDELKQVYERSTFPEEQRSCLSVMGCVTDEKRQLEMLEYTLFSGKVRQQDISFALVSLSTATDAGGKTCWNYLKTNFRKLFVKYAGGPMWGSCIGLCCKGLRTLQEADEVEAFFSDPNHVVGSAKRRLGQALEVMRMNAVRIERDWEAMKEFLEKEVGE